MTFSANQILTAAQLNDLDIDSLVVDTDVLVVDKTNNRVGIGTTSPGAALDVVGDIIVNDTTPRLTLKDTDTGTSNAAIQMRDTADTVLAQIKMGGSNDLYFDVAGSTRMFIRDNGNVGIANTTPDHVLSLAQISGGEQDVLNCVNNDGSEGFRVAAGVVRSATIANTTTSSSANVFVSTSSKTLFRSTVSALKYKTNVETMEDSYADAILGLRPVWYRSRCELDPESYGYWGFIAEEVAEIDPRLVTFGVPDDYEWQYEENGEKIEPDVADLTEPEGVQYDRLVPHLVNLLARQRDQIADLSARVTELKA